MEKDMKEVIQEIKEGVIESVSPAVTKDVMKKIEEKTKDMKPEFSSQKEEKSARAKETAQSFRDMYSELKSGAQVATKTLDSETEDEGLEWTPDYFQSEVLRIQQKYGIARNDCRVVPMRGKTETWPTAGSVSVSRVDEGDEIEIVTPESGNVKLTAKKVAAIIPMTRELVEYANIRVIDLVSQLAGEAMAKAEDEWLFKGLEAEEGIFRNSDVHNYILSAGKTSFENVTYTDLIAVQNYIDDAAFDEGTKYYLSRTVLNALRQTLLDESSDNLASALQAIALPNLATLPYKTSSVLPKTTDDDQDDTTFMGLYNLRHVLMGEARSYELEMSRQATLTIDGSPVNLWQRDMVAIRVMESIDFAVTEADKAFVNISTAADLSQ